MAPRGITLVVDNENAGSPRMAAPTESRRRSVPGVEDLHRRRRRAQLAIFVLALVVACGGVISCFTFLDSRATASPRDP
jgi:hypothetical protein